jgi:hypothetical protein
VRPGDRIEVTGVFRAVPHRANPHMRTVKSIYKTYLDVVHFRRADQGEDRGSAEDVAGIDRTVERPAGKELCLPIVRCSAHLLFCVVAVAELLKFLDYLDTGNA